MNNSTKKCALILAAGVGKRMKAEKPKALCEVLFRPMLDWVTASLIESGITDICIIIGKYGEQVQQHVQTEPLYKKCCITLATQQEQLGTGHAVMQASDFLQARSDSDIIILCGDAPFIDPQTISLSYAYHCNEQNKATVITASLNDPTGYGRIVRKNGNVENITEHKDTNDETVKIKEVNSGAFWFQTNALLQSLRHIDNNNSQHEYYLTDTISILNTLHQKVGGFLAATTDIVLGANDRKGLLKLNGIANARNIDKALENGVEFISTDGVIIGFDVEIGSETTILPGTIIKSSKIGKRCVIGPSSYIENSKIADDTKITASYICDYETEELCNAKV